MRLRLFKTRGAAHRRADQLAKRCPVRRFAVVPAPSLAYGFGYAISVIDPITSGPLGYAERERPRPRRGA